MMGFAAKRWLACFVVLVAGCDEKPDKGSGKPAPSAAPAAQTAQAPAPKPKPVNAVTVTIAYGSEKKTWLEDQAKKFQASGAKTTSGRPIVIDAKAMGSGEALQAVASGALKPH